MAMVTLGCMSGLPALPMAAMRPSLRPTSALTMPQWSMINALVISVSTTSAANSWLWPMTVADDFAATEFHFFAVGGEVFLDLDPQLGVGQAHTVADGRAEHVGVGLSGNFHFISLHKIHCGEGACPRSSAQRSQLG
jgi:hypothetical protein